LPSLLATGAGRDAWIAALVGSILELAILFLVINVITRNNDDMYASLRRTTTWAGAKFVMVLILAVFVLQLLILMQQSFMILNENLFANLHRQTFVIPILFFGVLCCFVEARSIFRSGEIFFMLIVVAFALAVFPAIPQMRPSEVLPILDDGFAPVLGAVFRNLIYFESAAFLLVFGGDAEIKKNFKRNFMIWASLVSLFFVFFVFMFTSLFGVLAPIKSVAIANMTLHSSFLTQSGRFDWFLVCVWLLLLLVRFGVTFFGAFVCIKNLFNVKRKAGYIGFIIAVALWAVFTFAFQTKASLNNLVGTLVIPIAVLFFLIPLFCFIGTLIKRRAKNV
jgi:spore germination protein KB